jgi:crotonobetainyl-CoA:carnitine CoA-transferase CaiB-like acyl-CoA transferase
MGEPEQGALAGVVVIDATGARSGPTCARQLADMGAEVTQIARGAPTFGGSDQWNLHRNKRSIHLDLKQPEDHATLLQLIDGADVFLENWRPDVKHRLGLGPEALLERNPRLVYGSISGFGQDGPYANRPGVDQITQGMSGIMSITGPPGTGPSRAGVAVSDLVSGTFLAQGVVAALFARERTGRGQWVRTSLLETMVNLLDFQATRWLIDGVEPAQEGNSHPTIPAMGTFETVDGRINIGVLGKAFNHFAELLGAPELAEDERFATHEARVEHRYELDALLREILRRRPTQEWIDLLAEEIPAGPVYRVSEVFADPQVRHLGLTATVDLRDGTPVEILRHPVTFSDTPATIRSGPIEAGQDTDEILAELARR